MKKIVSDGFEAVLLPAGFEPAGKFTWIRRTSELEHVITLLHRRGLYDVQWGIVSAAAVPIMWAEPAQDGNVGQAVVSGTPGTIHHPPECQSFRLDTFSPADEVERIASGIATDLRRVGQRLRAFSTRREVRSYLLLNREPKDRRDFVIPANLPLKVFTAATLAVLDHDRSAGQLVEEAGKAMARYKDEFSVGRLDRLRRALRSQGT